VARLSAQCHLVVARAANPAEVVGWASWSGCPLGQDAPVRHPEKRYQRKLFSAAKLEKPFSVTQTLPK
jgi:hypothetical protein